MLRQKVRVPYAWLVLRICLSFFGASGRCQFFYGSKF